MTEEKRPSLAYWEAVKQLTDEKVTKKPRTDSSAAEMEMLEGIESGD